MYHKSRTLHRWIGVSAALFLITISATGFLLANKDRWAWMRPPEVKGQEIAGEAEVVSIERAVQAAFAKGNPHLQSFKDIDRVDYRPKSNIFKVISREGYIEMQVDGKTAEVLSVSFRNDQLSEDIHDMSWFGDLFHAWLLPAVGLGLFLLGVTGVGLFFTPVVRRMRYRRARK
jgi:uncharacterized iron-regulated membrane protein